MSKRKKRAVSQTAAAPQASPEARPEVCLNAPPASAEVRLDAPQAAPPAGHAAAWPPAKVGMACFLLSEAAFFGTLIVAYITYLPQTRPDAVRYLGLTVAAISSVFLFSSSATVHLAHKALRAGNLGAFRLWWGVTIVLGVLFLAGTAFEWHDLIVNKGLAPWTNLLGTTYFTLVGFHAGHVTMGAVLLTAALALVLAGRITPERSLGAELISWYWHFVDGVWVVVFTLMYLIGR
jgi:cytochrome c oxidase subunit 3/cytochrome o ubiquinol oxidase subunit 3